LLTFQRCLLPPSSVVQQLRRQPSSYLSPWESQISLNLYQSQWFLKLSAARTCREFKPLFIQHVHAARSRDFFFKEFKLCAPDGSRSLIKHSVMPCHSYSGQQRHIDKQPEKREEKSVDHMSTYDCGIIFSVSIKYRHLMVVPSSSPNL
jgi:hypothetical protein